MEKMTCIGGPHAGSVIAVESGRDRVVLRDPERSAATDFIGGGNTPITLEIPRTTLYRVESIHGDKHRFRVLLAEGLSADDMIQALIAHYNPRPSRHHDLSRRH